MIIKLNILTSTAVDILGPTLNILDDEDACGRVNESASVSKDKPDEPDSGKLSKDAQAEDMIIDNETGHNRPDVLQFGPVISEKTNGALPHYLICSVWTLQMCEVFVLVKL
ncbi:unnamed protein product [Agarophyton chilense]